MAETAFVDPATIFATNPYLALPSVEKPHWSSTIGTMLANLGAGISSANASGMPWHAGIAPGAALATNALARSQKEQEAEAMRRFQMGIAMQGLNDKRTEAARKQQGAAAWADAHDPGKAPGFNLTPNPINMAPDFTTRTAALEGGSRNGGMVHNELGSGAYGPYQFMPNTWADVRTKNPELNLPEDMTMPGASEEDRRKVHDAAFQRFTSGNGAALQKAGFQPTPANLYLAHRFGSGGAQSVLGADPNKMLADVLPIEWQKQNPDMRGQTVGGFIRLANERMGGATGAPQPAPQQAPANGPVIAQGGGDTDIMTSPTPAPGTLRTPPPMREPPPNPPQVPRPMLPREDAAYLSKAVREGAMTPDKAEAEKLRIVGDLWKDQKEQAARSWQMQWDNYKTNRGELNKTDAWQTMSETEARERLGNAYDPAKAYQVNKTGEVKPIGGAQTVVNIDQKGDSEFAKKMGAMDAERFGKIFEAETSMNEMASKLGYAMDQFRQTYTGPGAETANYLNKILGSAGFKEAGEKANAADAAMAAISQMKPFMRAPGSGASSDRDMDMYARALPSLLNLPGGNERVVAYFQRMADRATRVRELAQEHSEGGKIPLTRTGFDDAVKKIGPLFTEDERKELTALAKGKPSAAPADPKKVDAIREKYGLMSVPEGGVPAPQATPQPVDVLKQKYGLQ